ncbi:hypothetical protein DPMN_006364 [Dreissena polymorpha]|uniref:Reverse transcriptase zinc-binding domain-containing protein n=1 Tax=Dreissena polymorpha TaxID=45954 RepID=A0A9D4MS94_DREPO|nr:hypothetical protein DPMN_006364 [Dreissena polymorpha]
MPYKATIESTLRNFQYKYIHRIIATNKYLFKCKLSNSNLCDFCSENIETIEHLFWECKHIQPIWNQLTSFLEQQQLNVKLSFLNFKKQVPNFNCFIHSLKLKVQIEKEIALSNDTLQNFEQKWNRIKFS